MSWQGVEGHDDVVELFRRAIGRNRLATTYLFVGPDGIGKRKFAVKLAQTLLCTRRPEIDCDPCGECSDCRMILGGMHPDVDIVSKPKDKSVIPLELFIGSDEKRMQEGLCHRLSLKPYQGRRKIGIIDDADAMNAEGANSLLKTLEEPPDGSVLILISTGAEKQLPTIRSRCQIVRFRPLEPDVVARLLTENGLAMDPAELKQLAVRGGGSLSETLELADGAVASFREELFAGLDRVNVSSVPLAKRVIEIVEAAGRDAPPRRERARRVLRAALDYFRERLRSCVNEDDSAATSTSGGRGPSSIWQDPDDLMAALDHTLEALSNIDRNVHLPTMLEWWIDGLSRIPQSTAAR